ncbi:hypothetical protein NIA69_02660 [Gemmiger formicilis]|nr:hypothetical protein [Gemmiger formicilis]
MGYGSCKITLTGGELRTLAQQDGTLCYTTEPLPLDSCWPPMGASTQTARP